MLRSALAYDFLQILFRPQRAGIDAAKAEGIYKERKKNVDDVEIRRRIAAGATKAAVARDLNNSRMTVYRALIHQSSRQILIDPAFAISMDYHNVVGGIAAYG